MDTKIKQIRNLIYLFSKCITSILSFWFANVLFDNVLKILFIIVTSMILFFIPLVLEIEKLSIYIVPYFSLLIVIYGYLVYIYYRKNKGNFLHYNINRFIGWALLFLFIFWAMLKYYIYPSQTWVFFCIFIDFILLIFLSNHKYKFQINNEFIEYLEKLFPKTLEKYSYLIEINLINPIKQNKEIPESRVWYMARLKDKTLTSLQSTADNYKNNSASIEFIEAFRYLIRISVCNKYFFYLTGLYNLYIFFKGKSYFPLGKDVEDLIIFRLKLVLMFGQMSSKNTLAVQIRKMFRVLKGTYKYDFYEFLQFLINIDNDKEENVLRYYNVLKQDFFSSTEKKLVLLVFILTLVNTILTLTVNYHTIISFLRSNIDKILETLRNLLST